MPSLWFAVGGFQIPLALVSIMLAVGGIVLGLGFALNEDRLKEFGRLEVYQSIINAVLVGSFLLLFVNGGIVPALTDQILQNNGASASCQGVLNQSSVICFAYSYLAGTGPFTFQGEQKQSIVSNVELLLGGLYVSNGILGAVSSVTLNVAVVSVSLAPIVKPFLASIQGAIEALSLVLVEVSVQAVVLKVIAAGALAVVLPVGLTLRTFYPTRKLGGFFIGLSIGTYVVFPLSYVLSSVLMQPLSMDYNTSSLTNASSIFQNPSFLESALSLGVLGGSQQNSSTSDYLKSLVEIPILTGSSVVSSALQGIQNALDALLQYIADLVVYTIVLPAFSLFVTWVSVRELSRVFGSDINVPMFKLV